MENMKLNNNLECPMLGLGTFMLSPEDAYTSTLEALKMGYSLIDTANAYVNERAVGRAIKDSGIDRKNIFLSTKIWASEYENENTVEETLERLGVDYVDLLYIHQPAGNWLAGYRMLEKAYREGKAKSIGISNFEGKYMEELETKWEIVPQFIQVEAHPYFTQKELRVTLLLRESRGIPQREKMKNNFQFESILKNANGDNKAFPKLGNVLMLPNQKNL